MDDYHMQNTLRRVENSVIDAKVNAVNSFADVMAEVFRTTFGDFDRLTGEAVAAALEAAAKENELIMLRKKR